jgi:hypothetical protein
MGRPPKDINEDEVFKLASYGCTQEEIGDFFGCNHAVISRRYSQAYNLGKASVRKNVRMWQMRRAQKGSDTMLIHLGKHYCGQIDKPAPVQEPDDKPATDESGQTLEP